MSRLFCFVYGIILFLLSSFALQAIQVLPPPPKVSLPQATPSPILVLAIDGAAVRGIAQLEFLKIIETQVNMALAKHDLKDRKLNQPVTYQTESLTDIFDFFAGTSAGSVNVGMLLIPDDVQKANTQGHQPKAKFSLKEIEEKVPVTLEAAFSKPPLRSLRTLGGALGSKFSAKPLEQQLKDYTQQSRMSDLTKPAVITSYDLRTREVMNFSTYDACRRDPHNITPFKSPTTKDFLGHDRNVLLWQAMRASAAAPVFYKPLELDIGGKSRALIDAGLFVMSPTLLAWLEVQKIYPNRPMVIISISGGTVKEDRKVKTEGATAGNALTMLKPTIETAIEGQQALTDLMMKELKGITYHRLNFPVISRDFDDVSEKNIQALKEAVKATVNTPDFQKIIEDIANARLQRRKRQDLNPYVCPAKQSWLDHSRKNIDPKILSKIADAYQK